MSARLDKAKARQTIERQIKPAAHSAARTLKQLAPRFQSTISKLHDAVYAQDPALTRHYLGLVPQEVEGATHLLEDIDTLSSQIDLLMDSDNFASELPQESRQLDAIYKELNEGRKKLQNLLLPAKKNQDFANQFLESARDSEREATAEWSRIQTDTKDVLKTNRDCLAKLEPLAQQALQARSTRNNHQLTQLKQRAAGLHYSLEIFLKVTRGRIAQFQKRFQNAGLSGLLQNQIARDKQELDKMLKEIEESGTASNSLRETIDGLQIEPLDERKVSRELQLPSSDPKVQKLLNLEGPALLKALEALRKDPIGVGPLHDQMIMIEHQAIRTHLPTRSSDIFRA